MFLLTEPCRLAPVAQLYARPTDYQEIEDSNLTGSRNLFRYFKKDSCQFQANESAQVLANHLED